MHLWMWHYTTAFIGHLVEEIWLCYQWTATASFVQPFGMSMLYLWISFADIWLLPG